MKDNPTQDDTFRRLSRATYEDARLVYSRAKYFSSIPLKEPERTQYCNGELEKIGWSVYEFNQEWAKRYGGTDTRRHF